MSWNPDQYLKFSAPRLRPAIDLLAAVPATQPGTVYDLGCGAGNVTRLLAQRWPQAAVTGVDDSAAMLAKAGAEPGGVRWVLQSLAIWRAERPADVIYSNASLHWLPGHAQLFPALLAQLAPGGVLAVQMPAMHNAALRRLHHSIADAGPWASLLADVDAARAILEPSDYYDILRPVVASLDIWETTYLHVLAGEDAVVQWAMGTSLKPFLDRLPPGLREDFLAAYAAALRPEYPRRADGTTLLPFRRRFIMARTGNDGHRAR